MGLTTMTTKHMPVFMTTWKPIPGTDGNYDVSDDGRVRSWITKGYRHIRREVPLDLKPGSHSQGYKIFGYFCSARGKMRTEGVHRLILRAFVGHPPEAHEAAHLDGDLTNNTLKNLAWVTSYENSHHKVKHGTSGKGEQNAMSVLTDEIVTAARKEKKAGVANYTDLAKRYGVSREVMGKACRGLTWRHLEEPPVPSQKAYTKMNSEAVMRIRALRAEGFTYKQIEEAVGFNKSSICSIC